MSEIDLDSHQRKAVESMHNGCILNGAVGSGKSRTALTYYVEKVCKGSVSSWDDMEVPMDLYVITTAKKRDSQDWQDDAARFGMSTDRDLSRHSIQVTVDSWNNIKKYEGVTNAFFILDEQRLVGSGAWSGAFIKIAKRNSWILLSATPGDTWLDYIPVFVANGFYKNRTDFKRQHVVYNNYAKFPKVDRYVGTGKLIRHRRELLVDLNYVKHTKRVFSEIKCSYDEELVKRVSVDRWHVYEERPLRDAAELVAVMRKVVNSDESRLAELRDILSRNSKVIVFYNFDYELEMLRTLTSQTDSTQPTNPISSEERTEWTTWSRPCWPIVRAERTESTQLTEAGTVPIQTLDRVRELTSTCASVKDAADSTASNCTTAEWGPIKGIFPDTERLRTLRSSTNGNRNNTSCEDGPAATDVIVAEWNGHKHEPIPTSDSWVYLVQYAAGSEGWNCIETDAMVFYSMTYSYKMFEQAQGRIDRRNTPFTDLYYYVLTSDSAIDKMVARSLKKKKNFNERAFRAKWDN